MTAAERARRHRERRRAGLVVVKIELPLFETADALVTAGWLQEWDADDQAKIGAALSAAVTHLLAARNA